MPINAYNTILNILCKSFLQWLQSSKEKNIKKIPKVVYVLNLLYKIESYMILDRRNIKRRGKKALDDFPAMVILFFLLGVLAKHFIDEYPTTVWQNDSTWSATYILSKTQEAKACSSTKGTPLHSKGKKGTHMKVKINH